MRLIQRLRYGQLREYLRCMQLRGDMQQRPFRGTWHLYDLYTNDTLSGLCQCLQYGQLRGRLRL